MKYLPSILSALVAVAAIFAPQMQDAVSQNPTLVIVLSSACQILMHLTPSPMVKK